MALVLTPVVAIRSFHALDAATGKEKWHFDNALSWVITSPAVSERQGLLCHIGLGSLSRRRRPLPARPILQPARDKALTCFRRRRSLGDVVFIGVLNGTLQARDLKTGEVLWDFQTETSKQNKGWVLTADRRFNDPLLYHSTWREAPHRRDRSTVWDRRDFLFASRGGWRGLLRKHRWLPLCTRIVSFY